MRIASLLCVLLLASPVAADYPILLLGSPQVEDEFAILDSYETSGTLTNLVLSGTPKTAKLALQTDSTYTFTNDTDGQAPYQWTRVLGTTGGVVTYQTTKTLYSGEYPITTSAWIATGAGAKADRVMQLHFQSVNTGTRVQLFMLRYTDNNNFYYAKVVAHDQISVGKVIAGVDTSLASGTLSLTGSVWHHAKLETTGTVLRAKFWAYNASEPGEWTLSYDTTADPVKLTSGYAGVYFTGWDLIWNQYVDDVAFIGESFLYAPSGTRVSPSISLASAEERGCATVSWTQEIGSASDVTMQTAFRGGAAQTVTNGGTLSLLSADPIDDDFEDDTIGAQPVHWNREEGSGAVGNVASIDGTQAMSMPALGAYPAMRFVSDKYGVTSVPSSANTNLVFRFRFTTTTTSQLLVRFPYRLEDADTHYLFYIDPTQQGVYLARVIDGAWVSLVGTTAKTMLVNTWYKARVYKSGSNLKLRVWLASDAEPGTWDREVSDGAISHAGFPTFTVGWGAATQFYIDDVRMDNTVKTWSYPHDFSGDAVVTTLTMTTVVPGVSPAIHDVKFVFTEEACEP